MNRLKILFAAAGLLLLAPASSYAVPTLQLYSDNAFYNTSTESWFTFENPFTLQVIGADQPNSTTYIGDVQLHFAVPDEYWTTAGSITIEGEGIGPLTINSSDFVYGIPENLTNANNFEARKHGTYEAHYYTIDLPDLMVSTAGETVYNYVDLIDGTPFASIGHDTGDIQYYEVAYSEFFLIHADLTGTAYYSDDKYTKEFAPFSHDADFPSVPEPNTLILLGSGFLGLWAAKRRLF